MKANEFFKKTGLALKKHSPIILTVAGIGMVIGGTILACKATKKAEKIKEEHDTTINDIHEDVKAEILDVEEEKFELAKTYGQTAIGYIKCYGPSALLLTGGIICIASSHHIMAARNSALTAAVITANEAFDRYRQRIRDEFGDAADFRARYGAHKEKIEVVETDENGNEKTVKKNETVIPSVNVGSDYSRFFDDSCRGWTKDAQFNLTTLRNVQDELNFMLDRNGFVFLNDAYKKLGIPQIPDGQLMGWIKGVNDDGSKKVVDFGIFDVYSSRKRDFVNGYENVILLDFNVETKPIYNLI